MDIDQWDGVEGRGNGGYKKRKKRKKNNLATLFLLMHTSLLANSLFEQLIQKY